MSSFCLDGVPVFVIHLLDGDRQVGRAAAVARTSSVASDTSLAPDWTFVLTSATRIVADEPSSLTELSVSPSASGNETPVIDAISGFETLTVSRAPEKPAGSDEAVSETVPVDPLPTAAELALTVTVGW